MTALFRFLILRHLTARPARPILAVGCIALGVALYVSLEAAHRTAVSNLQASQSALAGDARWRVTRGRGLGVGLDVLDQLEAIPGVRAAPVLEIDLMRHPSGSGPSRLRVRGVDAPREAALRSHLADADELLPGASWSAALAGLWTGQVPGVVSAPLAEAAELSTGDTFQLHTPNGTVVVRVAAQLPPTPGDLALGSLVLVPLPALQAWLTRPDRVDHIDVAYAGDVADLRRTLGDAVRIDPIDEPAARIFEDIVANMQTLVLLSAIGLLAGMFIIYQVVSVSVIERTRAVGAARALGAKRRQVVSAFLLEALCLGALGSLLGVLLGRALALSSLERIERLANLYLQVVELERLELPAPVWITGVSLGLGTALVAAFLPARRAARVPPALALQPRQRDPRLRDFGALPTGIGIVLVSVAVLASVFPPWPGSAIAAGYAPALMLFLGTGLIVPRSLRWIALLLRPLFARIGGLPLRLALDGLLREPGRAGLTAVALAGSMGLYVTASTQTLSAGRATDRWVQNAFPFDLTFGPVRKGGLYGRHSFPASQAEALQTRPEIETLYGTRTLIQEYGESDVLLLAVDLAAYRDVLEAKGKPFLGELSTERRAALLAGGGFAVSHNFALLHGVAVDDPLTLRTPEGDLTMPVLGTFDDFSWPKGTVLFERGVYREHWNDDTLTQLNAQLSPGLDPRAQVGSLLPLLSGDLSVLTGRDLREVASFAVNEAYSLVQAQVGVALWVGFLGTLATISISVLQRRRELSLLRAAGMTRSQLRRSIAWEAMLLTSLGALIGILAGLFSAAFPAASLLAIVTGYVLPIEVPWGTLATVLFGALILGVLASWIPGRNAAHDDWAEGVREA